MLIFLLMFLRRAIEVVMLEDRPRQAADYATKCARLMVKLEKYREFKI